jgi:hypothetical protein
MLEYFIGITVEVLVSNDVTMKYTSYVFVFFLHGEGPRSRCYGRTTTLRLFVQPCDEDDQFFLPSFTINGAPVE